MEKREGYATTGPDNPWPRHVSFLTTASALPSAAIAFYTLAKENPHKLLLYSGFWTALMFQHSDKPLTKQGFYWDLVLLPLLLVYPLPDIGRRSKLLLAAYIKAWVLFLAAMYYLACKKCPLEACPVPR
jgi:hypothetical protein